MAYQIRRFIGTVAETGHGELSLVDVSVAQMPKIEAITLPCTSPECRIQRGARVRGNLIVQIIERPTAVLSLATI